jgi:hypothetical protein
MGFFYRKSPFLIPLLPGLASLQCVDVIPWV